MSGWSFPPGARRPGRVVDWVQGIGRELLENGNLRIHFPNGNTEDWRPLVGDDFHADPQRATREFMEFEQRFYEPTPEARRPSQEENDTE